MWTYGRTDGRIDRCTDTPEFQSTRSSPGDDLKSEARKPRGRTTDPDPPGKQRRLAERLANKTWFES